MSIFDTARFVISAAKLSGLPPEAVPEIAFAGRSNAGKSTTINVLTRKTRLAFASNRISTSILWKNSNSFSILLWHLNSKLK